VRREEDSAFLGMQRDAGKEKGEGGACRCNSNDEDEQRIGRGSERQSDLESSASFLICSIFVFLNQIYRVSRRHRACFAEMTMYVCSSAT